MRIIVVNKLDDNTFKVTSADSASKEASEVGKSNKKDLLNYLYKVLKQEREYHIIVPDGN